MEEKFQKLLELIEQHQNFLVISHNKPDGDTLGANFALSHKLKELGKTVSSACSDPAPKNQQFLPGIDSLQSEFLLEDYEVVIVVDTGAKHLVDFFVKYPELNRTKKPIVCIDHHASHSPFGTFNIIDPTATSTTSLLYEIFQYFQWTISADIATLLLNGIYTDTGSFKHANTKTENFKIAAALIRLGADQAKISKQNFQSTQSNQLKLLGEILSNLSLNEDKIIQTGVPQYLLDKYQANTDDLSGLADLIAGVKEAEYSIVYTEHGEQVKASLRTNKELNLAKIAEQYGGGGHTKAAGYKIPGKLQKICTWQVI